MMTSPSLIIIGAGMGGLATGIYGQLNGFSTQIVEAHALPGGQCASWKRKGYTIDGAMNWLVGTNPGSSFYKFWEELGAAPDWKIYNHERYLVSEDKDGKTFTMYCDADRFEKYLLEMAPEDGDVIKEFIQAIRTDTQYDLSIEEPPEPHNESDKTKIGQNPPLIQCQNGKG